MKVHKRKFIDDVQKVNSKILVLNHKIENKEILLVELNTELKKLKFEKEALLRELTDISRRCRLLELSDEILVHIILYVCADFCRMFKNWQSFPLVCKRIHHLFSDSILWYKLIQQSHHKNLFLHYIQIDKLWTYHRDELLVNDWCLHVRERMRMILKDVEFSLKYSPLILSSSIASGDEVTILLLKFKKKHYQTKERDGNFFFVVSDWVLISISKPKFWILDKHKKSQWNKKFNEYCQQKNFMPNWKNCSAFLHSYVTKKERFYPINLSDKSKNCNKIFVFDQDVKKFRQNLTILNSLIFRNLPIEENECLDFFDENGCSDTLHSFKNCQKCFNLATNQSSEEDNDIVEEISE